MKRHATALRVFTHADEAFAAKQVILNMDAGQFDDWSSEGVNLVREAMDAEVAHARGDKPVAAPKPRRKRAAPKAAAVAASVVVPPVTDAPEPQD